MGEKGLLVKEAAKAVTGDVYVRRWTVKHGKKIVEHEVHVNPVTIAVGAGITAVGAGLALWVTQQRLKPTMVDTLVEAKQITIHHAEVWHATRYGGYTDPAWDESTYLVTRLGRKYYANTAVDAILAAYPGVSPSLVRDNIYRIGQKKKLLLEERKGFEILGEGAIASAITNPVGSVIDVQKLGSPAWMFYDWLTGKK